MSVRKVWGDGFRLLTFRKYLSSLPSGERTVILPVLVHADVPCLSADSTFVPCGITTENLTQHVCVASRACLSYLERQLYAEVDRLSSLLPTRNRQTY